MLFILFFCFSQNATQEIITANFLASDAIKQIKANDELPEKIGKIEDYFSEIYLPFSIGSRGLFKNKTELKVLRVLDENKMLVYVTDKSSFKKYTDPETVLISGINTDIYKDGSPFYSTKVFNASGFTKPGSFASKYLIFEPVPRKTIEAAKALAEKQLVSLKKNNAEKIEEGKKMLAAEQAELKKKKDIQIEAEKAALKQKGIDSINKLLTGLKSSEKRFIDSRSEPNEKISKQMASQAEIYISNANLRLSDALKLLNLGGATIEEKAKLTEEVKLAISKAKKTLNIDNK